MRRLEALIDGDDPPQLGWRGVEVLNHLADGAFAVFLGTLDGIPHFAVAVGSLEPQEGARFIDARTLATLLPAADVGILGNARSLVDWHARHRFCAQCGAPTEHIEGGARRRCTRCDARHYPRVDPSVIMLVEHNDRILLARRATAPGNRRSCLAGFLEPGESIEEAVAREVFEEAGVTVTDVRYVTSQPWPFPSQLMIGCRTVALSDEVNVDGIEIASAEWFDRAEVRAAVEGRSAVLEVPGPIAIAYHLIRTWAYEQ
ncbi:MAG: NAD(+) diphosphatase [Dehalococcoidia bacterium]|nr:NAD(+) diphosphatase [Dehalococcoidia bacterium]